MYSPVCFRAIKCEALVLESRNAAILQLLGAHSPSLGPRVSYKKYTSDMYHGPPEAPLRTLQEPPPCKSRTAQQYSLTLRPAQIQKTSQFSTMAAAQHCYYSSAHAAPHHPLASPRAPSPPSHPARPRPCAPNTRRNVSRQYSRGTARPAPA